MWVIQERHPVLRQRWLTELMSRLVSLDVSRKALCPSGVQSTHAHGRFAPKIGRIPLIGMLHDLKISIGTCSGQCRVWQSVKCDYRH